MNNNYYIIYVLEPKKLLTFKKEEWELSQETAPTKPRYILTTYTDTTLVLLHSHWLSRDMDITKKLNCGK